MGRQRHLTGASLSLFDPVLGVGATHHRVTRLFNTTVGAKMLLSLPTAVVQSVSDGGDEAVDPLVTAAGIVRVPLAGPTTVRCSPSPPTDKWALASLFSMFLSFPSYLDSGRFHASRPSLEAACGVQSSRVSRVAVRPTPLPRRARTFGESGARRNGRNAASSARLWLHRR